jgi:UDP-2,3-diacylglucosamine pyrophosphatase LpxH
VRRLLILSDLHVGRDCNLITNFNQVRPNPEFDQAFVDLLAHYTAEQESDWKLILGGDFIDFMEVVVVPGRRGPFGFAFEVTDEEREFGLGSEPERAVVKLQHAMEYHVHFFEALANFVHKGGEVVIVRGNHDVEMYWPKVQRFFRRQLATIAFKDQKLGVDEAIEVRNDFQTRIDFAPWFYYEKDRIWFEHGHQYDPYCSFDHWLHPISPTKPGRLDTPVSSFAMRYFVNILSDFSAHQADLWGWRDYLQWLSKKGFGGTLYMARSGAGALFRLLRYAVQWSLGRVGQYKREHTKKMNSLAEAYDCALRRLKAVDGMHAVPVTRNLPELMRLLFLDRFLLVLGSIILAAFVLLIVQSPWLELVGMVAVAAAAYRLNKAMVPRRYFLPGPKQAIIAGRIAEIMQVPVVAMGHSHVRRVVDLGPGKHYVNTGCWLPPPPGKAHDDPEAPCTCKLSHLVVLDDNAPQLRVFCKARKDVRLTDVEEMSTLAADGTPETTKDSMRPVV